MRVPFRWVCLLKIVRLSPGALLIPRRWAPRVCVIYPLSVPRALLSTLRVIALSARRCLRCCPRRAVLRKTRRLIRLRRPRTWRRCSPLVSSVSLIRLIKIVLFSRRSIVRLGSPRKTSLRRLLSLLSRVRLVVICAHIMRTIRWGVLSLTCVRSLRMVYLMVGTVLRRLVSPWARLTLLVSVRSRRVLFLPSLWVSCSRRVVLRRPCSLR